MRQGKPFTSGLVYQLTQDINSTSSKFSTSLNAMLPYCGSFSSPLPWDGIWAQTEHYIASWQQRNRSQFSRFVLASNILSHPAWYLSVGFSFLCLPPDIMQSPISLQRMLASDDVVLVMGSCCDDTHTLRSPNLTPGLFQSIRSQPSSTKARVKFWISYLPYLAIERWAVTQFLHLTKPVYCDSCSTMAVPCWHKALWRLPLPRVPRRKWWQLPLLWDSNICLVIPTQPLRL